MHKLNPPDLQPNIILETLYNFGTTANNHQYYYGFADS